MRLRQDDVVTVLLVGACVAAGAAAMLPRLLTRPAPLVVEQPPLQIAVLGEVAEPGVYELPFGSRVADAVAAAGGMLPSAAADLVNAAGPLTDGQSIHVPSAMVASADGVVGERVSLNSAPVEQLDSLPGIGPVIAQRIVLHRPYDSLEDVLRVPGIGPATFERLAPLVGL